MLHKILYSYVVFTRLAHEILFRREESKVKSTRFYFYACDKSRIIFEPRHRRDDFSGGKKIFCDEEGITKGSKAQSYELRSNRCRVSKPPEHLMKYN